MLHKVKKETQVDNIFKFLSEFDLEERFKKDYGLEKVEDWDFRITDDEIIKEYLGGMPNPYFVTFNPENTGSFTIYEFEKQKIYEITDPNNGDDILFTGNEYFLKDLLNTWLNEAIEEEPDEEEKLGMRLRWRDFNSPERREDFVKYSGLVLTEIFEV